MPASTPKRERPTAKVVSPPPYVPELDAYGLKLNEDGQVVPAIACPTGRSRRSSPTRAPRSTLASGRASSSVTAAAGITRHPPDERRSARPAIHPAAGIGPA